MPTVPVAPSTAITGIPWSFAAPTKPGSTPTNAALTPVRDSNDGSEVETPGHQAQASVAAFSRRSERHSFTSCAGRMSPLFAIAATSRAVPVPRGNAALMLRPTTS